MQDGAQDIPFNLISKNLFADSVAAVAHMVIPPVRRTGMPLQHDHEYSRRFVFVL